MLAAEKHVKRQKREMYVSNVKCSSSQSMKVISGISMYSAAYRDSNESGENVS